MKHKVKEIAKTEQDKDNKIKYVHFYTKCKHVE